ncbi:MAG: Fe-S cluster assembly protein SufD [Hyphomicrobiales bacterium]|nr:Fe-S cluster assembly protein SufD [Hyphomicrobiales bacterium]MBP9173261.1 Fe-S cluster assembly protein SufD [Hyphomicrobiales bacterium]MCC7481221.1 Fe-S cluster assembly protein SufD [Hyphomicrobiales bacterium]
MVVQKTAAEMNYGLSLPHRKMEDWRWTDLRQLVDKPYPPRQTVVAAAKDVERLLRSSPFAKVGGARMVFVNGRYAAELSQLKNDTVTSTINVDEPVITMNAAFATDGACLKISGTVDTPIELLFITTNAAARTIATRNVVEIEQGAAATLIETHLGEGSYLSNSVTQIRVGEGARLDRIKVELEAADAIHLSHVHTTLGKNSVFNDFTLTSGAKTNRQNGTVEFKGQGSEAKVSGAFMLGGRQHADTRLVIDHQVPHCTSRELFKCVMDDNARGIFQGKVIVQRGAQKTDGKQSSHALLLSETAEFDAKPELEIFADDVVCGHGATSGDLNHDHLFYLMSRGIPPAEAKSLLIAAFVGEAFDLIAHEGIKEALVKFSNKWLSQHRSGRA